jgi:antirestriction protein ArdC
MATSAPRPARFASDRTSLYRDITDRIIAELRAGRVPWVQPWGSSGVKAALGMPSNAISGHRYSGVNVLILWAAVATQGFATQQWLTFRQALALGGNVRKGERGTTVVYARRFTPDAERRRASETGDTARQIPFLKRFTVFNAAQCDGLPDHLALAPPPADMSLVLPRVDELIRASGVDFRIGGDAAFYLPAEDFVQVPRPEQYYEPVNWHRTALHELSHASGHKQRLNRDLSGSFGSRSYAFEELVAEISAAYLCATLNITPTVRHADYIGSWLECLENDERAIVRAASAASKAANYLLGFLLGSASSDPDPATDGADADEDAGEAEMAHRRAA